MSKYYLSVPKVGTGTDTDAFAPDVPSGTLWAGTTTDEDDRYIIVVNSEQDRDAVLAHNNESVERSRTYLEALADARGYDRSWIDGFSVS